MKINRIVMFTCIMLSLCFIIGISGAFETPESITAAANVHVSQVTLEPGTLFTGDTGTATIDVKNSDAKTGSVVNHVSLTNTKIRVTSNPYDSSTHIGPTQTVPFVFSFMAEGNGGTYYPDFSLSFRDADGLYRRLAVEIDNHDLDLTVTEKPDAFTPGKKKTITVEISNPRKNDVRNVVLDVSGDGITTSRPRIHIGDLAHGASKNETLSVTPDKETTLNLTLNYDNGNNPHSVSMTLPILFGTDKKQPDPVINNIKVTNDGNVIHVKGDVLNAGLETAYTVTVTALSPAVPQDPYKTYVVGALKPDDFGGTFEVTFTADPSITMVPLKLSFKDADGNSDNRTHSLNIALDEPSPPNSSDSSAGSITLGAIILVGLIGGLFVYLRKSRK